MTNYRMSTRLGLVLLLSASLLLVATVQAETNIDIIATTDDGVVITEISDKGTSGVCNGKDWIELYNPGDVSVDLGADLYVLHDDRGLDNEETFAFPPGSVIDAKDYMLLCTEQEITEEPLIPAEEGDATDGATATAGQDEDDAPALLLLLLLSPQFGISGDDIISLTRIRRASGSNATTGTGFSISQSRNGDIYEILSRVPLPNTDDAFDVTYAMDPVTGIYNYTSTPTPGAKNIMTRLLTLEERHAQLKAALKEQNDLGTAFFGMDDRGFPTADAMDTVLDLSFTMLEGDYAYLVENKTFEQYRPFQTATVKTTDGVEVASLNTPGNIRSKGQSSLFLATCVGTVTFPFQVEFADNATLFGMERIYLRHHVGDYSYMRDYAYNRMLARFGLPHTRARKVRVTINGNPHGLYTLLEAPDQDYVFHRSFPDFDPQRYALYKIKSFGLDCGSYTADEIATAEARLGDLSTPPYAFERGEHKPQVPTLSLFEIDQCIEDYDNNLWTRDYFDVILAWLRNDRSCADMLLNTGLIDLDLGNNQFKKEMEEFISVDFSDEQVCDVGCANSNLKHQVDVENFLKSFAFYAVTMNSDTPLINGNNYYLAQSGAEQNGGVGGWKIVPYDFNLAEVVYCHDEICNDRLVHWSVARPTCTSLEASNVAGPLLADEKLHAQYLEYVREFVETIYGNESFVEELQEHAAEQDAFVRDDFWSLFGAFYDLERSPDTATWSDEIPRYPLLPTMKARTEDVRAQLAAIDAGTFPRGPFVGVNGDNEPWEPCADWRLSEPNTTACPEGCKYESCYMSDWTVSSYCDEETGKCLHGDYDEQCRGIFDGDRYAGMQDAEDGRKTFCRFSTGVPVKAMECPAVGAVKLNSSQSAASRVGIVSTAIVAVLSFLFL